MFPVTASVGSRAAAAESAETGTSRVFPAHCRACRVSAVIISCETVRHHTFSLLPKLLNTVDKSFTIIDVITY